MRRDSWDSVIGITVYRLKLIVRLTNDMNKNKVKEHLVDEKRSESWLVKVPTGMGALILQP